MDCLLKGFYEIGVNTVIWTSTKMQPVVGAGPSCRGAGFHFLRSKPFSRMMGRQVTSVKCGIVSQTFLLKGKEQTESSKKPLSTH